MRYLVRLTGDADVAADALQETFVRLMTRPPRDERAKTWLFTVATNVAREGGRTATRRRGLLRAVPPEALVGDGARDPAAELQRAEHRRLVSDALAALSERDRTALLMREEGFSHEEIARAVHTTTKSVGTIIARALRKLAGALHADLLDADGRR
jgi:RNA polymerase sigma factor (sigma-70 family)